MAQNQNELLDVLTMLDRFRQDPGDDTKRKYKRHSIRTDARLEPMDDASSERPSTILLRDISRGGVGFLSDRFLDPGNSYRVRFLVRGQALCSMPIVVCFCRLVQDNLYMVGGQFVIEPSIMAILGVPPEEIDREALARYSAHDVSDFLTPEAAMEGLDSISY